MASIQLSALYRIIPTCQHKLLPETIALQRVHGIPSSKFPSPTPLHQQVFDNQASTSSQMKHCDESGCLDFSQNEVKLRATGKELDDTISFFNNLTAQLKYPKQGGSYQQL
ncbi:hypothetical protein L3Y34_019536 [Caenorhabditis briggsae]|uniref:Uncharacterized protein n=2 Tax=Caenorhabditis briggsae TaxID=6238 RepID=A0AAE9DP83_CAEBR|nr:hypothetical protein L3Y34_019536 [Caenorhabditis briggsae]